MAKQAGIDLHPEAIAAHNEHKAQVERSSDAALQQEEPTQAEEIPQ